MQSFALKAAILEKTNLRIVYVSSCMRENLQLKVYFCGYQNYSFIYRQLTNYQQDFGIFKWPRSGRTGPHRGARRPGTQSQKH